MVELLWFNLYNIISSYIAYAKDKIFIIGIIEHNTILIKSFLSNSYPEFKLKNLSIYLYVNV